jgi:RAB protein geranylgeranyltransferase component A
VYRQLDFLAVGSWWVYSEGASKDDDTIPVPRHGQLLKVPNGREDVFQDQILDFKAKRSLMKFLRFISEYEDQPEVWEEHRHQSFPAFLSAQFKVPDTLHAPLLALTLSTSSSMQTSTEFALPRIARHLRSIGVFGAGFGSVIPKWGGMSEITQVACRASAVGGGVYVLGSGLSKTVDDAQPETAEESKTNANSGIKLRLENGEAVTAQWVVGQEPRSSLQDSRFRKSITIVSSSLAPLFPPISEEAPIPAAGMVVFPSGSLKISEEQTEMPPVHIFIHSSDTGECPVGQSKSKHIFPLFTPAFLMILFTNTYLHCLNSIDENTL